MVWLLTEFAAAATIAPPKKPHAKAHHVTETPTTQKKMAHGTHSTRSAASAAKGSSKSTTTQVPSRAIRLPVTSLTVKIQLFGKLPSTPSAT